MKLLLLLSSVLLSATARAQAPVSKKVLPTEPANLADMLQNSANPRFKVLEKLTPVYRQPTDTLNERQVFKLTPGTRVYIRKAVSRGYMITLFFGGAEEYYLPYNLVADLPTQNRNLNTFR